MCGKRCMTRCEAGALINDTKKRNQRIHSKHIPKRAYYCDECKSWHVTSDERK